MTPLEMVAKARWESRAEGNFPHRWEDFTDEGRKAHMEDMRAALLALAEADLPETITEIGISAYDEKAVSPMELVAGFNQAFRAMCRAIAESGR